jgi:hypothetical protein
MVDFGHADVSITLNVYAHVLKTRTSRVLRIASALLHGLG